VFPKGRVTRFSSWDGGFLALEATGRLRPSEVFLFYFLRVGGSATWKWAIGRPLLLNGTPGLP
jgi:hypothetical protein